MKPNELRKQIRFTSEEELKTIHQAVEIISNSLIHGERVTFSSFIRAAAIKAAINVINSNAIINKDQG